MGTAGPSAIDMPQYNKRAQMSMDQAQTRGSAVGYRFLNLCPISDPDATPNIPASAASQPTITDVLLIK